MYNEKQQSIKQETPATNQYDLQDKYEEFVGEYIEFTKKAKNNVFTALSC